MKVGDICSWKQTDNCLDSNKHNRGKSGEADSFLKEMKSTGGRRLWGTETF